MISGHPHRPGTARLLAVCVLLFGLFAMHGLPASAADGCHTPMAAAPISAMADGMAPASGEHTAGAHADALPGGAQAQHGTQAVPDGQLCLSTLGRDRITVAALAALALLALVGLWSALGLPAPGRVVAFLVRRRRGPPTAGRSLLHLVCISRT